MATRRSTRTPASPLSLIDAPDATMPSLAPDVEPIFNSLRRLVHALHTASRESERSLGLTGAQLFVLTQLRENPSLSVNALAERTLTHQSTVSVVVQRLVRRKLVKKIRASGDARRVELTLTPAGSALLQRAPEAVQTRLLRAIDEISTDDRQAMTRGLQGLVAALGADDTLATMFFEVAEGE